MLTFRDVYKTEKKNRKVTWDKISSQSVNNASGKIGPISNNFMTPSTPKPSQLPSTSIKVIEEWLEETLNNVNELKIPGHLLKTEKIKITSQYGIDRLTLNKTGLSESTITRIYRCLFVYSTGFHQLLTSLLAHCEGQYTAIKNIWRTFAVLLEY